MSASHHHSSTDGNPRKRRRPPLACEQCRNRKIKCDRSSPCAQCARSSSECTYVYDDRLPPTYPNYAPDSTLLSADPSTQQQHTSATHPHYSSLPAVAPLPTPEHAMGSDTMLPALPACVDSWPLPNHDSGFSSPIFPDTTAAVPKDDQTDGDHRATLHAKTGTHGAIQGVFSKSRLYGLSHWINYAHESEKVLQVLHAREDDGHSDIRATFAKCKAIGKQIKLRESTVQPRFGLIKDFVPSRAVSDQLVQAYMRTFEGVFRILHVPSFRTQYNAFWDDRTSSDQSFGIILLLVMAIGSIFVAETHRPSRTSALQWILTAQIWLSSTSEKDRMNLEGVRTHCLLLLARQTNAVHGDVVWLQAGSLLNAAMHIGLHVDPDLITPKLTLLESECWRRLWATVLELSLQSSMDRGAMLLINADDYNCTAPANIDDGALQRDTTTLPHSGDSADRFTHCSMQILLLETLPIRLRIAKFINSFKHKVGFKEALALSDELTTILRCCQARLQRWRSLRPGPSPFQVDLYNLLTRRFMLALHSPFAYQANLDQTFYYSRKLCLDTSMSLLSSAHTNSHDGDFYRLQLCGTGLYREVYAQAVHRMCVEVLEQISSDGLGLTSPSAVLMRREIRDQIDAYVRLALARVEAGEKTVKGVVFFSCHLAQIDALQAGESEEQSIAIALKNSLEHCLAILSARTDDALARSDSQSGQDAWTALTVPDELVDWSEWTGSDTGSANKPLGWQ